MAEQVLIRPAERTLFRQAAIDFQRQQRRYGEIATLQPPSIKISTGIIAVSIATLIIFVFFAQYTRKETVAGYLSPTSGTAKVITPRPGIIKAVHVVEGQQVEQGQPLLTVENSVTTADGQNVDATVLSSLITQRQKLSEQVKAQTVRAFSEQKRLNISIENLSTEISFLDEQIETQNERIKLAKESLSSAGQLKERGNIPLIEYRRRQEDFLEQRQMLYALHRDLSTKRNELVDVRYALEQLPTTMEDKIQGLRNELASTEQRIAEIDGRHAYVILAPRAGRVSALQAKIGQVTSADHLQLEILPTDSALQAELFVPTRAIGFVRTGQRVRLLFDAFPYQRFGVYGGSIAEVSQTVLTGADIAAPITLREPVYKVTVTLDRPDVDAYGRKLPLQAGMMLRADMILDKRPLVTWLLDPLLSARM